MYLLQSFDGCLIFLGELQRRRHFGGAGHDLGVQLPAFGHQSFLVLVGVLEGSVEFLVLCAELFHARVLDQLIEDGLEVRLQRLKGLHSIFATLFLGIMVHNNTDVSRTVLRYVNFNCTVGKVVAKKATS